jgi:hypothetical protein
VDAFATIFMLRTERIDQIDGLVLPPKGTGVTIAVQYAGQQFRVVDVSLHLANDGTKDDGAIVFLGHA